MICANAYRGDPLDKDVGDAAASGAWQGAVVVGGLKEGWGFVKMPKPLRSSSGKTARKRFTVEFDTTRRFLLMTRECQPLRRVPKVVLVGRPVRLRLPTSSGPSMKITLLKCLTLSTLCCTCILPMILTLSSLLALPLL